MANLRKNKLKKENQIKIKKVYETHGLFDFKIILL